MIFTLTDEQRAAVEDELVSQAIVACAGSGKTTSAIRRLVEIRHRMAQKKGYVVLLSYSNVAVDTFRAEYQKVARLYPALSDRIVIATVDSFIAANILLPHGQRSMSCAGRPFLVQGSESWLNGFTFYHDSYPRFTKDLDVSYESDSFTYSLASSYGRKEPVQSSAAITAIEKLAKSGAYTYALARYWAVRCLVEEEELLKILACRYPFILVDEAQDVGSMHGLLLSLLLDAGVTISLIGDPNQAIYEFADADGSFLRSFAKESAVNRPLTQNRRSVSQIVEFSNALSAGNNRAIRSVPERRHGTYFLRYDQGDERKLIDAFKVILSTHGYSEDNAVILCRGSTLVTDILGGAGQTGSGATERFAQAAIYRDLHGDIAQAFECAVDGLLRLMETHPERLRHDILGSSPSTEAKAIRRLLWQFLKMADSGLPDSVLRAKTEWHPRLKNRLQLLFDAIEGICSIKRVATLGQRLSTKGLDDTPLLQRDLASTGGIGIRTKTVHKAKGEGIDAVLYITKKPDLDKMLAGTYTEDGRIGYVAVTRARDLLLVGIPSNTKPAVVKNLEAKGLVAWS